MTIWAIQVGRLGDEIRRLGDRHRDIWATKMNRGGSLYAPIVTIVALLISTGGSILVQNFRLFPLE